MGSAFSSPRPRRNKNQVWNRPTSMTKSQRAKFSKFLITQLAAGKTALKRQAKQIKMLQKANSPNVKNALDDGRELMRIQRSILRQYRGVKGGRTPTFPYIPAVDGNRVSATMQTEAANRMQKLQNRFKSRAEGTIVPLGIATNSEEDNHDN